MLVIAACTLFYSGYAAQIEREGFTTPPFFIDMVTGIAEGQIEGSAATGVGCWVKSLNALMSNVKLSPVLLAHNPLVFSLGKA